MYTIILNFTFFALAGIAFLMKLPLQEYENVYLGFTVVQYICLIVGTISVFATSINQMSKGQEILGEIEDIKTLKNKISLRETKKDELVKYMEEQILNVFPKFEERILKSLAPSNNTDLVALFQKYPELKSSKHLSKLVEDYGNLVAQIYNTKEDLENKKGQIREYLRNPWFIYKVKMSDEFLEFLDEDLSL